MLVEPARAVFDWEKVMKSGPKNRFAASASDDVRREKVEHIKTIVAGGTYAVPATRVAAKLLRHMLDLDRISRRRR